MDRLQLHIHPKIISRKNPQINNRWSIIFKEEHLILLLLLIFFLYLYFKRSLSLNQGGATTGLENKYYNHQQPAQMNSTSSSGNSKDDSLDQSDIFDPTIRHCKEQSMSATIGPCLAKLDPAVAQAVQSKFQVCIPFLWRPSLRAPS